MTKAIHCPSCGQIQAVYGVVSSYAYACYPNCDCAEKHKTQTTTQLTKAVTQ